MKNALSLFRQFMLAALLCAVGTSPALLIAACGAQSIIGGTGDAGPIARETARGAVTVAADALVKADAACAALVASTRDKALGERCDAVYKVARTSLVSAAIAVDTWDSASSRADVTCVVLDTAAGLGAIGKELKAKGGEAKAIEAIDDAVALSKLVGACTARKDGGAQ